MRQISKNGWRQKEPDDVPYTLNESIFQGAVDLLIEQKVQRLNIIIVEKLIVTALLTQI